MNNRKTLISTLSRGNPKVLGLILGSALFVTLARIGGPFSLGWDQAIQLEAANRLIEGLGLTSTYFATPLENLNRTPLPQNLTWWPPGFPLLCAGFLYLGLPLVLSLKLIYGFTTLGGWLGWGMLGSYFLARPIKIGSRCFSLQLIIAILLPVFYTPTWQGTDIFLWSGIPFFVLLLIGSGFKQQSHVLYLIAAGLVFGLLYSIRYASIFLAITAIFILCQINFSRPRAFIKSYFLFLLSSSFIILPVCFYNFLALNRVLPCYLTFKPGLATLTETVANILTSLSAISALFGFPPLKTPIVSAMTILRTYPLINIAFGLVCVSLVIALPGFLIIKYKPNLDDQKRAIIISLAYIMATLTVFIAFYKIVHFHSFDDDIRYYVPAIPSFILIIYELITLEGNDKVFPRFCKTLSFALVSAAVLIISLLFVYTLISKGNLAKVKGKWGILQRVILCCSPVQGMQYPSNKVITPYTKSRLLQNDT